LTEIRYPAALFSNPAMLGPAASLAPPPPKPAPKPAPLAAAPDARRGIQIATLAEGLPSGTRTDPSRAFTCGAGYKLYPEVARQPDGKDAIVYWKAFNAEAKRVDFLVGPDSLSRFTSAPSDFATAAANAYMGEQDAATRESAKVVDLAVREGFGPAIGHLGTASKAAWSDPKWVAKTLFNVASAGAGTASTKAACTEARTEASAVTASSARSPVASTVRAHTIADVNPGYPRAPGRTMNCVNCAVATDATLAGRPATALPSPHPLQLADIEQSVGGNFRRVGSPAEIEAVLLEAGPGARAVVAGARAAPNPGHVFNAVNVEGRVYFVDGQSGGAAVINDPTYVKWGMLQTTPRKP
jgi:hypothetical protein